MKNWLKGRNDNLLSSSHEKWRLCVKYGTRRSSQYGNQRLNSQCKIPSSMYINQLLNILKNGVVTGLECNYMGAEVGKAISQGILEKPVIFRSHGGRAGDMENGSSKIDIAFLAAPCADNMGNCSGNMDHQPVVLWDMRSQMQCMQIRLSY